MGIRVGINGFGRIGRSFYRAILDRGSDAGVELVAVNDPMGDSATMAFLLKHDSVGGRLPHEVKATDAGFSVDGKEIRKLEVMNPGEMRNAPDTRMAAPSLSSRPGSWPVFIFAFTRLRVASPSRFTRIAPSTAVKRAIPNAQPKPILEPTQRKAAISAREASRNRRRNLTWSTVPGPTDCEAGAQPLAITRLASPTKVAMAGKKPITTVMASATSRARRSDPAGAASASGANSPTGSSSHTDLTTRA